MIKELQERIRKGSDKDENGCWIWRGTKNNKGYGQISVRKMWRTPQKTHRVSAVAFGLVGEKYRGLVLHKCDVRACVNPKHIYAGTYSDNNHDAIRRGRMVVPHKLKLSDEQVKFIRANYKLRTHGLVQRLAERHGVTRRYIHQIVKGQFR